MRFTITPQTKMSEIKELATKWRLILSSRATFLYYRILKSASSQDNEMKKIALIIGSIITGGIICGRFYLGWQRRNRLQKKRRPQNVKSYSGTTRCIPIRGSINQVNRRLWIWIWCRNMPMKRVIASGVRMSPTQTQNLGVENGYRHARTADFCPEFPGECQLQRYQYAIVQARAAGFIDKVYPLTVGDKVQKGTPLLDLTIPDWVEAQTEYLLLRETGGTATKLKAFLSGCDWRECRRRIFAA